MIQETEKKKANHISATLSASSIKSPAVAVGEILTAFKIWESVSGCCIPAACPVAELLAVLWIGTRPRKYSVGDGVFLLYSDRFRWQVLTDTKCRQFPSPTRLSCLRRPVKTWNQRPGTGSISFGAVSQMMVGWTKHGHLPSHWANLCWVFRTSMGGYHLTRRFRHGWPCKPNFSSVMMPVHVGGQCR